MHVLFSLQCILLLRLDLNQYKAHSYIISSKNGGIQIQSAEKQVYKVVNTLGQLIAKGIITSNNQFIPVRFNGILFVQINREVTKLILTN